MYDLAAAVVGTGFMGPVHTEGLRRLGIRVIGILGSSEEKSRRAADALGLEKAYPNLEALLEDDEVQSVHVTSPNRLHLEQAGRCLEAGKHVLCEKPLAMTSDESAKLVQLAEESGLVAGVNYNLRFFPVNFEARHKVQQGEVGDVVSIYGSYVQDWLLYPTDYNWRVIAEQGGKARTIGDIGTHWMDLMQFITGLDIEAVFADLKTVYPTRRRPLGEVETFSGKVQDVQATEEIGIETEDLGAVLLHFKGGAHGSLWVSQMTAGRKNCQRYEISGTNSAIAWNSEQPNDLWIGHRDRANEVLLRDPGLVSDAARAFISYPGGHNEGYGDTFKQCFKAFYDYIAAGDFGAETDFATFADGHKEILLCEAILKSHSEGKWVAL
jgi:predicted dehydrogenase